MVSPVISLPNSQSAALLPTSQPIQRQYATLPRKGNNNVAIGGTLGRSPAPMPPRRDPKTTLSVGRARARSMVAGLGKENSKSKQRFDEEGLRNDFFSSGAQKAVGRETIATKSHRRGLNRVARSPSIFPSSHRPDPTPDKTHRCSRGRPVSDRGPPPVGSPPRNWRYERIESPGDFYFSIALLGHERSAFLYSSNGRIARETEASALSFLSSRNYFSGSKVVPVVSTARP